MPSAATTFTNNNNNSKEKRASVSSIGASSSVGGGVGGGGSGGCNNSNGQHSSNTNLADCTKTIVAAGAAAGSGGSQTDLTNNNNVNAKALKLTAAAAAAAEPYNPLKQILVTIEHKIRNLEKRKVCVCVANIGYKPQLGHRTQWLPTIFIFIRRPLCFGFFLLELLFPPCARRFFATPCLLSRRVARPMVVKRGTKRISRLRNVNYGYVFLISTNKINNLLYV